MVLAHYAGKTWKKEELRNYIGSEEQLAFIRSTELREGKGAGVRALQFETGGGLSFSVLPGRGMDIPDLRYKGWNMSFFSGTGIVSPAYYEEAGTGWLRNFYAGLLTTCGITYAGHPQTDNGTALGLHGRIANTAAENLSIRQQWSDNEYILSASADMRQVSAMGEYMTASRTVQTGLGSKQFRITDCIENRGFEAQPLMMLYHFNFGFPLLSSDSEVIAPLLKTEGYTDNAKDSREIEDAFRFPEPVPGYAERVFIHKLAAVSGGRTFIALVNRQHPSGQAMGIKLSYSLEELPGIIQWKMPRQGFYATGLEPCTVVPFPREKLRREGRLPMLDAQSEYRISIDVQVLDGKEEIAALRKEAAAAGT